MIPLPPDVTSIVDGLYGLGAVVIERDRGRRTWSVRLRYRGWVMAHAVGSLAETIGLARRLSPLVARHGGARPLGPRFWREVERIVAAHHRFQSRAKPREIIAANGSSAAEGVRPCGSRLAGGRTPAAPGLRPRGTKSTGRARR